MLKEVSIALEALSAELIASQALNAKLCARIEALEAKGKEGFDAVGDGKLKRAYRFQYEGITGLVECYENATRMWWNGKEYVPREAPSDLLMAACKADPIAGW